MVLRVSFKALIGFLLALAAFSASAQAPFPSKPIRIIVGAPPGGANDTIARIVAQRMDGLGQPVIVENRTGAAQMIAAEMVAKAPPDGHTLLIASQTILAVVPIINKVTTFDPLKDFAAVTLIGSTPLVLVVSPSLPANTVRELIALAKARPGELNFGSGGVGTTPHMAGELFAMMAGVKLQNISYKGEQPALTDMLGGQLPMMFSNVSAAMPHVKSGKLRGLAVTSAARIDGAPGLPTVAEAGLPGYETATWLGIVAPAATSREVVAKINAEIQRVMALPEVKEKLIAQGLTLSGGTPEQFGAYIRSEHAKWGNLIKDAGIKAE
ncbi:MAG: tripartite tricarboxylate transporter substrate binding protein [Proteobacteria bacterium]|nr:tripartite tricarboxylate transporter substrate binding protein [Pseudomonadota bacterium]